jgi:Rrf2 family protein
MLKLTKKADYGLIALKHLALNNGRGAASAKDIAERYGVPQPLLAKILQKMARHGLLVSHHGTYGGYLLARSPDKITALEVIRLIDGPVLLTACSTSHGDCDHTDKCNVREPLRRVHDSILELLNSITIAELMKDESQRKEPCSGGASYVSAPAGGSVLQVL